MGLLAESKSRSKISKDPNNTKWTRDTTTFGQKILHAQGWEPGQYLGAQGAAHSELHTAANASYIRISLKDDFKGLGYNKAKEDEVTGLDVFSDLLNRLNGKSEEAVEGERQARLAMKTNMYVEQKWGPMRFVRGGMLVGDIMEDDGPRKSSVASQQGDRGAETEERVKEKKSKKRKASDVDKGAETDAKRERKRRKEERKANKVSVVSTPNDAEGAQSNDKKRGKKKPKTDQTSSGKDTDAELVTPPSADDGPQKKPRKSKSKDKTLPAEESDRKEKKDRKERKEKKEKREKKRRRKAEAELAESKPSESSAEDGAPDSAAGTGVSTPTDAGTGTSTPRPGRNFVRSRFIAAKRQAMLDTKALSQIFMVKA